MKDKIIQIRKVGKRQTYDFEVSETNNFVAQGIVIHNSSSIEQNADMVAVITGNANGGLWLTVKWNRQGPAPAKIKLHANLAISLIAEQRGIDE